MRERTGRASSGKGFQEHNCCRVKTPEKRRGWEKFGDFAKLKVFAAAGKAG